MKYYTITDAKYNPLNVNDGLLVLAKDTNDIMTWVSEDEAWEDLYELTRGMSDWLAVSEKIEMPLKVAILDIQVDITPLSQPNNKIKFI